MFSRRSFPRSLPIALSLALATGAPPAQQTWHVSTQAEFLAALQAAAPGDIVQLAAGGLFGDFTLTKGLTIRGPATIGAYPYGGSGKRFMTVPAGQVAQCVDVTFVPDPTPVFGYPDQGSLQVSGVARFEHCTLVGSAFRAALILVDADVAITRCSLAGQSGSAGMWATDANVNLTDTTVRGSSALRSFAGSNPAAPGLHGSGQGSLHASRVTVTGGDGGDWSVWGYALPAPAIDTSVPTWLSDSFAQGGGITGPYPGAPGITGTAVWHTRCSFAGGAGSPPGQPTVGNVQADPTLLGASSSGPLLLGAPVTLTYFTDGVVDVAVLAWARLGPALRNPVVTQPLWFGTPPVFVFGASASPAGSLSRTFLVPLVPALRDLSLDFVGLRLGGVGLQASPLLGGVLR